MELKGEKNPVLSKTTLKKNINIKYDLKIIWRLRLVELFEIFKDDCC